MFCYTTINSKLKYSMSTAVKQDLNFSLEILFSTKEMSIIRISNLVIRVLKTLTEVAPFDAHIYTEAVFMLGQHLC